MRFGSDPASIRGSIAPLITPFHPDGVVDLDSVGRLVDWQLDTVPRDLGRRIDRRAGVADRGGAAGRDRSCRSSGRGPRAAHARNRSARLDETLWLTAEAEGLGADAVLVITPFYSRRSQQGLYEWFSTVAAEYSSLPIVIYNVPVRTAVDIRLRRSAASAGARKHRGDQETTRDFEHVSYVLHECGRDFLVYCGIELLCYPTLTLRGRGHLSSSPTSRPSRSPTSTTSSPPAATTRRSRCTTPSTRSSTSPSSR